MTDPVKELVRAAKAAVKWMEGATLPNESNKTLRRLQEAVKKVEARKRRKDRNDAQATL